MSESKKLLESLAERIRFYRERKKMTQEEFARRCGISTSFASLLERGGRSPSYETLLNIALALDISLAELLRQASANQGDDADAMRLVDLIRTHHLTHSQVDKLLAVGKAMFGLSEDLEALPSDQRCTVQSCKHQALARGLCSAHYHRARRARN